MNLKSFHLMTFIKEGTDFQAFFKGNSLEPFLMQEFPKVQVLQLKYWLLWNSNQQKFLKLECA